MIVQQISKIKWVSRIEQIGRYRFSTNNLRGFLRSGVGQSIDTLEQYVENKIVKDEVICNLQLLTQNYLQAIAQNNTTAIQELTKKKLGDKTIQWMNEVNKKGQYIQQIGNQSSTSLQCFTSFNYLYGLENNAEENKEYETQRVYNLNKNFLVKRMLFTEGIKLHKLLLHKSISAEAIVYTHSKLQLQQQQQQQQQQKKEMKQNGIDNQQYTGYKVCFVCDAQLQDTLPYAIADQQQQQEQQSHINKLSPHQQKLYKLNAWKIADINDWVFGELATQDFSKWIYNTVIDLNEQTISNTSPNQQTINHK